MKFSFSMFGGKSVKYWPIIFALIAFVHTTAFTSAIAATEFKCEQVHGGPSILQLGRDKTVEHKKLPIGEWTKAQALDKGNGWVSFKDGYGFVDEETTKGQEDSNCKKSFNFWNLFGKKQAIKRNENSIEEREPYHDCNWAFGICLLVGGIIVTIGQHYRILDF